MSAAPPPPTGPAPVPPAGSTPPTGATPPVEHPPGHPHHGKTAAELAALEVQDNALYRGMKTFWARLKSGKLLPSKVLAVVILVVVGGGLWWWYSGQSRKADSHRWSEFLKRDTDGGLKTFIDDYPNTTPALLARRSRALNRLAAEGTEKLKVSVEADRLKGADSIATARDELVELAGLFKKDRTMKAACLGDAATGERALVGVPKPVTAAPATAPATGPKPAAPVIGDYPANSRGSVAEVARLYKEASDAIGTKTPSGVKYATQAAAVYREAAGLARAAAERAIQLAVLPGVDPTQQQKHKADAEAANKQAEDFDKQAEALAPSAVATTILQANTTLYAAVAAKDKDVATNK